MELTLKTLWDYRHIILVAIAGAVYVVKDRQAALELFAKVIAQNMLHIEKLAREQVSLRGPEKMEWVVQQAIAYVPKLPIWLRSYFTEERIRKFAQWVFDVATATMDEQLSNSVISQQ
jgi:hypothetical protein